MIARTFLEGPCCTSAFSSSGFAQLPQIAEEIVVVRPRGVADVEIVDVQVMVAAPLGAELHFPDISVAAVWIERKADGSWDLAEVKVAWSGNTDRSQQRREHGGPIDADGPRSGPGQAMTFMQARTANGVLKTQKRRVRLQRMKGELVDRARAVAQVFRLAREERDAWTNWPARSAQRASACRSSAR